LNLIFQVFGLTVGIVVFLALAYLFMKNKNSIFIYYGLFLLSILFKIIVDIFIDIPVMISMESKIIIFIAELSDYTFLITSPLFLIYLTPIKYKMQLNIIFAGMFIINFIFEFIMIFINYELNLLFVWMNDISFFILFVFVILLLLTQYKKIESPYIKRFLRFACYISIIFLPLLVLFDIMEFTFISDQIDFDFDILYFIVWNLASIIFFLKYFYSYALNSYIITPSNSFLEKIALSERQLDVFNLLIKGFSYKEIAQKLFISPVTVKTHVLNIYKKANVKNKIALLQKTKELYF
jgi:DNA-binding CsgD family transcriptional regulator